jgi:hypothetical protein
MRVFIALQVVLIAASGMAHSAPRTADPDWPCQQVKVGQLSPAAFWPGPPIDPAGSDWRSDNEIADLAGDISKRRMPIDTADQQIAELARRRATGKQAAMVALFNGVFDILNDERESVIAGLDRFGQRQKTLADNLRIEEETLRTAQENAAGGEEKVAELGRQLAWDMQFFEARRVSLRYACDVPNVIEQRLYALSRAIQKNME